MTALPPSGAFTMVDQTYVAALGPAAAVLFSRIMWRAGDTGEWRATRSEMAAETGLTPAMIRSALDLLREREWITSRRTSTMDATMIWAPVCAGQPEIAESASRDGGSSTTPLAESAISSFETTDTNNPLSPPPEDDTDGGLFSPPNQPEKPKRAHRLPADFRPQPAHFTLAAELGVDLSVEGPQFVDHHTAKGSTFKDWDAALRTWIRNAAKFRGQVAPIRPAADKTWGPAQQTRNSQDPFARGVL